MASFQQTLCTDEDCNQPSQERLELLERLQKAIGNVPPHFWAACHVCDLEELDHLVRTAELNPNVMCIIAGQVRIMIVNWNQSSRGPESLLYMQMSQLSSIPPQSVSLGSISSPSDGLPQNTNTPPAKRRKISALTRSRSAQDSAAKRDNYCCILTGFNCIEITYIYPFCLLGEEHDSFGKRHIFWHMLRSFWPEEKVVAWRAEVFPNGTLGEGIETAANMIALSPNAHLLWKRGAFALKPISLSDDNTTLTVQFFWQARHEQLHSNMDLLTIPLSTRDLNNFENSHLSDQREPKPRYVKSGDLFVMKTDDPTARPLPSFAFLEMQWFLQRVMGMAGAAYVEEYFERELGNSDDGISDLGLTEVGDTSLISHDAGPSDRVVPGLSEDYPLPTIEGLKHQTEEIDREEAVAQH